MKLGTLLLRDAVVTLTQLEAALRAQVIYGGRLGTNLVELGFLDVDVLGGYLARVLEVPLATREHLEGASPEALGALGPGLADVYTAVPIGFMDDSKQTLAVAMSDPKNESVLTKLKMQTGMEIWPFCAPELRLQYYLEKHYNLSRKARFVRTGRKAKELDFMDERRRSQPAGGVSEAPAFVLVPSRPDTDREFALPKTQANPRHPVADIRRRILSARTRQAIGEAIIDYADGRFGAAVLFLLRDQNAIGWRVHNERGMGMESAIEELSLPLGGSSVLQVAADGGQTFRGRPTTAGKPVESRLWEALGHRQDEPAEVMVVPIVADGEVVSLLYVHGLNGEALRDDLALEVSEIASVAAAAFERLIREAQIRN